MNHAKHSGLGRFLFSTRNALLLSDFCALLASLVIAYLLRKISGGDLVLSRYAILIFGLPPILLFYAAMGLYADLLLTPSDELKILSIGTTLSFLFFSFILFLGQQNLEYSRLTVLMCWFVALILAPLFRFAVRKHCAPYTWWGYPVIIFAPPGKTESIAKPLMDNRQRGLIVAESVSLHWNGELSSGQWSVSLDAAGLQETEKLLQKLQKLYPRALALVNAEKVPSDVQRILMPLLGQHFYQVIVRMDTAWLKQYSLRVGYLPGGSALSLRQKLLDPRRMCIKRLLDIIYCLLGSVVIMPLIPLLALCIRLDSEGPIFFRQQRIGQGGKVIRIYKFRTMVANAQDELVEILKKDPALREKWAKDQKLPNDPRLTRVGAFLRRVSLDELPQVFNVIKGEMSFVGPRPIVENEIPRYGEAFSFYTRVKPGITGLWQISGRNDVKYAKRVELDKTYIYNWSVWMDIYIMIRTIPALLTGRGAY
ncbi:MAG: undecaprenyl-phosphate galactose phosphotransferase WbaP [Desulfovibrio sp.]|jgi:Undecaprenyl-phosphate galactose phosphotransferase WbaP|nr:undecaprenyl-phosphate galactose phosphotransferase WbaP [Desulfovibrio sp.]